MVCCMSVSFCPYTNNFLPIMVTTTIKLQVGSRISELTLAKRFKIHESQFPPHHFQEELIGHVQVWEVGISSVHHGIMLYHLTMIKYTPIPSVSYCLTASLASMRHRRPFWRRFRTKKTAREMPTSLEQKRDGVFWRESKLAYSI